MLILKVDALGGDHIDTVTQEMVALAKRLNVGVRLSFNGVHLFAHPRAVAADLAEEYDRKISKPRPVA